VPTSLPFTAVFVVSIIGADFAAAVVLISFGAVLGKVSAMQLLLMALMEVVLFQANQFVVINKLQVLTPPPSSLRSIVDGS